MTERVAERVKHMMREHPGLVVHFTAAVRADSYHYSMSSGHPEVFLHPDHKQTVDELRATHELPHEPEPGSEVEPEVEPVPAPAPDPAASDDSRTP